MSMSIRSTLLTLSVFAAGCGEPATLFKNVMAAVMERTETKNPLPVAAAYREAHNSAPVVIDLHADTLGQPDEGTYLERILTNPDRDGQVDVPRLIQGNVALQVFAVTTKISIDTLGNALPGITGKYVDANGVAHSRYGFERDPNVPEYDDPNDPYAGDYAGPPLFMPKEAGSYLFRLSGFPCKTWYDDGHWDPVIWGPTAPCPEFNPQRMYIERMLSMAQRLRDAAATDSRVKLVRSRWDLDLLLLQRALNKNLVGGLLATEGLYFRSSVGTQAGKAALQAHFNELYSAGFRMFSLTHFMDNDHGGSSTGMAHAHSPVGRDISEAGQLFAELVIARGGVLDVAHASDATLSSLTALARSARRPLVFSHGGLSDIPDVENDDCVTDRNLTAAQVRDIASTGGVVELGREAEFVCGTEPIAWARAVRHAVDAIDASPLRLYNEPTGPVLRGVEHVALGSDYDGGIAAYTDVAHLEHYTRALICQKTWLTPNCLERPFTVAEAHKILGGNALRVLRDALPAL